LTRELRNYEFLSQSLSHSSPKPFFGRVREKKLCKETVEFAMTSKQFATISLSPQARKVETDSFFLALNKNDPNKETPQSIYDHLSEPGRVPNANLTRAFVNTVKGMVT
jgi:hypothetical protein